jgi:hypothetical protein
VSATRRNLPKVFKTKFFGKQARKAGIGDAELCRVIQDLAAGKGTDLGGGVYKKRLDENRYRSIIVAKSDLYWVFEFLFAKKDTDNITSAELDGFRTLADSYAGLRPSQLTALLKNGDLKEICNDPRIDKSDSAAE